MNLLMIATVTFASCTECPKETRDFLNIPTDVKCDMIKWKLDMSDNGTYQLSGQWGYYVNNSTWTKQGELVDPAGSWKMDGDVCTLMSKNRTLQLLKLDDNIFQIIDKDKKIVPGGAGFANTFNRVNPVRDKSIDFKPGNTAIQQEIELTGRTPLKPFDKLLGIVDNEDHDKIKWLIKLHANGTMEMRRTLEHIADYKGTWTVSDNVYKLDFEKRTLYLLKASDDVYYFMTPEDGLLVGNHEFGMSLIRRAPSGR